MTLGDQPPGGQPPAPLPALFWPRVASGTSRQLRRQPPAPDGAAVSLHRPRSALLLSLQGSRGAAAPSPVLSGVPAPRWPVPLQQRLSAPVSVHVAP